MSQFCSTWWIQISTAGIPNWSQFIALHLFAMVHISFKSEFAPLPVPVFSLCRSCWMCLHMSVLAALLVSSYEYKLQFLTQSCYPSLNMVHF